MLAVLAVLAFLFREIYLWFGTDNHWLGNLGRRLTLQDFLVAPMARAHPHLLVPG